MARGPGSGQPRSGRAPAALPCARRRWPSRARDAHGLHRQQAERADTHPVEGAGAARRPPRRPPAPPPGCRSLISMITGRPGSAPDVAQRRDAGARARPDDARDPRRSARVALSARQLGCGPRGQRPLSRRSCDRGSGRDRPPPAVGRQVHVQLDAVGALAMPTSNATCVFSGPSARPPRCAKTSGPSRKRAELVKTEASSRSYESRHRYPARFRTTLRRPATCGGRRAAGSTAASRTKCAPT